MSRNQVSEIICAGGIDPCIDDPTVRLAGSMVLGTYGGNSHSGANKNEDGALLWSDGDEDWEFAAIIDGHNTSESVHLLPDNSMYWSVRSQSTKLFRMDWRSKYVSPDSS